MAGCVEMNRCTLLMQRGPCFGSSGRSDSVSFLSFPFLFTRRYANAERVGRTGYFESWHAAVDFPFFLLPQRDHHVYGGLFLIFFSRVFGRGRGSEVAVAYAG
jgi:hypothetical protein